MNKVTFVGYKGGHRPSGSDPALSTDSGKTGRFVLCEKRHWWICCNAFTSL